MAGVDRQAHPGDGGRQVGVQPQRGVGDRLGGQEGRAAQGAVAVAGLEHVGGRPALVSGVHVPGGRVVVHRRPDRAGVDGVAPDAVRRELQCDVAHEADHAVLGGHVVGVVPAGLEAVHRRGQHDGTAPALDHVRSHGLRRLPHTGQVDAEHLLPRLLRQLPERCPGPDARVGDEDVDPAEGGERPVHRRVQLLLRADVRGDRERAPAQCLHLACGLGEVVRGRHRVVDARQLGGEVDQHDVGTLPGAGRGVGPALATGRAGDEDDPVGEQAGPPAVCGLVSTRHSRPPVVVAAGTEARNPSAGVVYRGAAVSRRVGMRSPAPAASSRQPPNTANAMV